MHIMSNTHFTSTVLAARLLAAVAASALASGAMAQIDNITSEATATQKLDGVVQVLPAPVPSPNYDNGGPGGAGYAASADISGSNIFFQSGAMSAGKGNSASSSIGVSFDVTNTTGTSVTKMVSTIFESNFGFYAANFAGGSFEGQPLPNCSGANLPNCVAVNFGSGFSDFTAAGASPKLLASTTFNFEVLQDGNVVRTISGQLDMVKSGSSIIFTKGLGFDDLSSVLNNFSLFEVANRVYAYSWDRTNFTVDLLDPIDFGETSSLSYKISTSSTNYAESGVLPPTGNLVVAFSCFADPVGRGGTSRGAIFTIPDFGPSSCNDYSSDGSTTTPYTLKVPRINGDTLDFTAPGVPEPDTWAMLIIGFGLVGLSMRRRSTPAAATVTA